MGIGIIFDAGETGAGPDGDGLVVNGLAPNGPADRCAKIVLGDLLCTVDGMDVKGIAAGLAPCIVSVMQSTGRHVTCGAAPHASPLPRIVTKACTF